jgi:hypothetical protein
VCRCIRQSLKVCCLSTSLTKNLVVDGGEKCFSFCIGNKNNKLTMRTYEAEYLHVYACRLYLQGPRIVSSRGGTYGFICTQSIHLTLH